MILLLLLLLLSFERSDQDTGLECDGLLDGGHTIVDTPVVVPHAERPVHDRRGGGRRERLGETRRRLCEMGRAGRKTGILVRGGTGRRAVVRLVGFLVASRSAGTDERGTRPATRGRDVPVSVQRGLVGGRNVPAKQCRRGRGEEGRTRKGIRHAQKRQKSLKIK